MVGPPLILLAWMATAWLSSPQSFRGERTVFGFGVDPCRDTIACITTPLRWSSKTALNSISRRNILTSTVVSSVAASTFTSGATATTTATNPTKTPKVTHRLQWDVRVSRADGTFYYRDNTDNDPNNQVYETSIVLELFGVDAPNCVNQFLQYCSRSSALLDETTPSYSQSVWDGYDATTGLLSGGKIPSLTAVNLNGNAALQYANRVLPSPLWLDAPSTTSTGSTIRSHTRPGLLTHRNLDLLPNFGVTTFANPLLDRSHTVFGQLQDSDTSREFLRRLTDLPQYRNEPLFVGSSTTSTNEEPPLLLEDAAASLYNLQRTFFQNTAQTLGDTRLAKVYPGKFLRRVQVSRVQAL